MNLKYQIRQKLVDGIINGAFPPGMKLPSSRKLAQQLEGAPERCTSGRRSFGLDYCGLDTSVGVALT